MAWKRRRGLWLNGAVAVLTWKHAECAVVVDFQATPRWPRDSMLPSIAV